MDTSYVVPMMLVAVAIAMTAVIMHVAHADHLRVLQFPRRTCRSQAPWLSPGRALTAHEAAELQLLERVVGEKALTPEENEEWEGLVQLLRQPDVPR